MNVTVKSFRDLMAGHKTAEIVCRIKGEVVRKLRIEGRFVVIDAGGVIVTVGIDDATRYEPWVFDRGNLLFSCDDYPTAKLCTDQDIVRYPDGSEATIVAEGSRGWGA